MIAEDNYMRTNWLQFCLNLKLCLDSEQYLRLNPPASPCIPLSPFPVICLNTPGCLTRYVMSDKIAAILVTAALHVACVEATNTLEILSF